MHFSYRRMSYHQLGMRTGVMKHGYVYFCALSYPVLGSHVFFLGCVAAILERPWVVTVADFPLEIFVSLLAAEEFE